MAATVLAGAVFAATPAMAQEEDSFVSVSGNVAIVSDYRFRGVGLSDGDFAVQGGIDFTTAPGFYVGVWGSSLANSNNVITLEDSAGDLVDYDYGSFGGTELNIYGGWSGEVTPGLTVDVGALYYIYPNATNRDAVWGPIGVTGYPTFDGYTDYDTDVIEFYGSLGVEVGPAGLTLGIAYAPKQDSLGGDDNLYLYGDVEVGIPGTPLSLTGHLGYTDGALGVTTLDAKAWDYSIGASVTVLGGLSLGVAYVGVEHDGPEISGFSDDKVVGTLSYSF